jgi:superfamily I DNA and/or RNA helicase
MVLAGQGYEDEVSVLVLAPYSAQVYALDRSLSSVSFDSPGLRLEVNTVDAAQGREADVIIFSTTRSNQDHQIGFLKDLARANVALSRGKFFLAIVGDASFFDRVESPFKRVLSFIRSNPDISAVEIIQS